MLLYTEIPCVILFITAVHMVVNLLNIKYGTSLYTLKCTLLPCDVTVLANDCFTHLPDMSSSELKWIKFTVLCVKKWL
jgi:hypothetical protein